MRPEQLVSGSVSEAGLSLLSGAFPQLLALCVCVVRSEEISWGMWHQNLSLLFSYCPYGASSELRTDSLLSREFKLHLCLLSLWTT